MIQREGIQINYFLIMVNFMNSQIDIQTSGCGGGAVQLWMEDYRRINLDKKK